MKEAGARPSTSPERADLRLSLAGLAAAVALLACGLLPGLGAPWTDNIDANGACWSQSAHNTLKVGLRATRGVPSAFYFDTPPIPPEGFYTHHPPLLSLLITGLFAVFGERESVARALPVAFSFAALILLWRLLDRTAGRQAAGFGVMAFAAMPMELHYGKMVNFEPITLVWMLAALEGLRLYELERKRRWLAVFLAALWLALCTAWLGYFFVLLLAISFLCLPRHRHPRLAAALLGMMAAAGALFLFQIHLVRPAAWSEMAEAVTVRMAHGGPPVSWGSWAERLWGTLVSHLGPAWWIPAIAGAVIVAARPQQWGIRWAGWAALLFFCLNALYVVLFRNASAIHDYASFYFTLPAAIFSGIGLQAFSARGGRIRPWVLMVAAVALGIQGLGDERRLARQFHILDAEREEPANLIPELGRAMRSRFPEEAAVICNFLPSYGPQLHYYAGRNVLNGAQTPDEWRAIASDPENAPVAGAIWLDAPGAAELEAKLPPGSREETVVAGCRFCFWMPASL